MASKNCINNVKRMAAKPAAEGEPKPKPLKLFHDDTLKSFFRRLTFTPDGELLIVPAGCLEEGDQTINTSYVFSRGVFNK